MIDLVLVLAFVVYALVVGVRARRQASRNLEEYFLAGRTLSSWQSGASMTATQFAADTPLLAAGLVATGGIFALWRLWIYGIAFLLLGFLLGRAWWRTGVVTDAELCELRYSGGSAVVLRGVKAVYYGLIFNCAVLAMVLGAAVRIAEPFLLWDQWLPGAVFDPVVHLVETLGIHLAVDPTAIDVSARTASNLISILAIFLFTMTYSATGGLRGVVATDIVQLVIAIVGTGAFAWFAVRAAGGLSTLRDRLVDTVGAVRTDALLSFDPTTAAHAGGMLMAVLGLQWLVQMNSDGTGYLAQRCMACRSETEATRAPIVFAFVHIVVRSLVWLPIFVALLILYPLEAEPQAAAREYTFVLGMKALLPPGFRGLMLVGLLAALASTLDTHLNWGASYLTNDLYGRLFCRGILKRRPSSRSLVWVARLSNPFLVMVSLFVMTRLESIQEAWTITLLLGAGLGVPLLLRWFWSRANAWGELAAIGASAVAAPILLARVEQEPARLLLAGLIGTLASVVASLVTKPVDPDQLRAFYERVQPPGFWGEPEARKRLMQGSIRMLAAAMTLFTLLVGLGTWLVGGTPPTFFGHRRAWVVLNLMFALALVPVWWPRPRVPRLGGNPA